MVSVRPAEEVIFHYLQVLAVVLQSEFVPELHPADFYFYYNKLNTIIIIMEKTAKKNHIFKIIILGDCA